MHREIREIGEIWEKGFSLTSLNSLWRYSTRRSAAPGAHRAGGHQYFF